MPNWKNSPKHFEKLYQEHHRFIRTVVYWVTRDDSCEDIVQEVFIKAWKNRENFQEKSSVKTWLYRIAMNCCYDSFRKQTPNDGEQDVDLLVSEVPNLEDGTELKEIIDIALKKMSDDQRESFVLFYKLGLSQNEISELRDIPVGTVKSQLASAREIFSKVFKKEGVACEG